jgi:peptidyl-prolyl cis-trans isomerase C
MRNYATRLATLALCLCMGAPVLAQDESAPQAPQTLVTIDGFEITNLHFALFASQTGRNPDNAEGQISLLNELVNNFMVANSPQGKALASDPELAAALEVARARLIAQAFVRDQLENTPVDEARVRELYDLEYANSKRQEYKARHILLANEEDAKQVIKELDGGADFATLASERSTGPSKSAGGDLGWFESDQMVSEFSAATAQLVDGSYTTTPVKTRFGWHVILREESREAPPPDFNALKPELERKIRQQQIAEAITAIRDDSTIEVQEQNTSETPENKD